MKRGTLIRALFVLGLLMTAAVLILRSRWTGQKLCDVLQQRVPALAPGVGLRAGQCQVEPLHLGVALSDVSLDLPDQPKPTVTAKRVEVQLSLLQALWGSVRLSRVSVERPRVHLDLTHLKKSPEKPHAGRCAVASALQQVDVARLAITDGQLQMALPGDRTLALAQVNVGARSRRGVSRVRIAQQGGSLTFPGGAVPLDELSVGLQLDAPSADVEVERLRLQGGQLSVVGHGSVRDLCDPDLNVEVSAGIPLELAVVLLQPKDLTAKGYLNLDATLSGKLSQPVAHAEIDLSDLDLDIGGNDINPKSISASVDAHGDQIDITQLYWPFPDGAARVSANIVRKGNWPISATVDARHIPFGELMNRLPLKHVWVDVNGSVRSTVTGHLKPSLSLSGPASVDLDHFVVRTRAWDAPGEPDDQVMRIARAHLDTELNITPERVRLTRATLTTRPESAPDDLQTPDDDARAPVGGKATISATLYTDPKRGLDLTGDIERFDLGNFGPIVGLPWSGVGSASGVRITGAYGDQVIDGVVKVGGFSFAGAHLGQVSGAVHFDPSFVLQSPNLVATVGKTTCKGHGLLDFSQGHLPRAAGAVTIDNGRLEDLLDALHDLHWTFELFHGEATGNVRGTISLQKSPILAPTSNIHLQLSNLTAYQRPLGQADFRMRSEDGEWLRVPDFTVSGPSGTFVIGGSQQMGGKLDYHVRARDVPLAVVAAPELSDWDMKGTLSGQATIGGTQQQAEIRGAIDGTELGMFGVPLGRGKVQIHGVGDSMSFDGPVGDEVTLHSRMRWSGNFPTEATIAFDTHDLHRYVPATAAWRDVGGELSGTLTTTGDMTGLRGFSGSYVLPKVILSKGDQVEQNTAPVRLDYDGDTYVLRSFSFRSRGGPGQGSHFQIAGSRQGLDRALDLRVSGSFDARVLEMLTADLDGVRGRLGLSAHVGGTQSDPQLTGTLTIAQGRLKLRGQPIAFDDLDGSMRIGPSSVEIDSLKGVLNQGPVSLSGSVGLSHFSPSSYDLSLLMDRTRWRVSDFPMTTLSGSLQLTGRASLPVLSGSIDVDSFVYDQDLELNTLIANATRKKLDAQTFTKRNKMVRFEDLQIHLDGDVEVRNNLVRTKLKGDLNVLGDNAHPLLRGDIEGAPGGKAFYRGNEFSLDQLLVSFRDSERITPEFDIHATTVARDYRIALHAFGTPDATHTELTSSPNLSQGDIVTLLTLGFTSQDRSSAGNGATLGIAADVLSTLTGVDRAAERFIPKNAILRDPSIRFTSTYSQALGSMQPTAEVEGKLFVDQLRLRLQEPVVAGGRGLRMQGEYRFNDSSSVQVQLDRDNSDYNFPDVGLDLKLRWEMK